MQTVDGTWTYAADPRGGEAAQTQQIYNGSTLTFGSDGSYAFKLGATPKPLAGTYTVASWSKEGGVLHTDYGQGRTNQLHLSLHRDGEKVVGFIVRETDQKVNPRYYAR